MSKEKTAEKPKPLSQEELQKKQAEATLINCFDQLKLTRKEYSILISAVEILKKPLTIKD